MLNRGEQTLTAVTGSGGRLHFGMVAGIKSERWPTSNRNPRPDCVGIRTASRSGLSPCSICFITSQPATPAVSLDEASEFLRLVGSSPDRAELFEAMLDRKADREAYEVIKAEARAKNQYPRHPRGALTNRRRYHAFEVVGPNLRDLNHPAKDDAAPCGIFIAVAKFNGERVEYENGNTGAPLRLATSVVRWDRVAVDIDDKDLTPDQRRAKREDLLAKLAGEGASPSAVVLTSDEKSHFWWSLETPLDPAAGNDLMKFLASALDADGAASLMTQVLRLPGFVHWKAKPQAVRLDRANSSGFKHNAPDLIAAIRQATGYKAPKPRKTKSGGRNYTGCKSGKAARGLNADLTSAPAGATNVDELVDAIDFLVMHPSQPLGEHHYHEWCRVLSACCVVIIEQEGVGAKILPRMDGWLTALGRVPAIHENRFRDFMERTRGKLAK